MKLLIITQRVDAPDPVLGFFHRWIMECSKHFESLTVVCLQEGQHDLPGSVKILSLGKEKGNSRIQYIANFYRYIWSERKNYDAIFVHMNQEYVLLGGLFWKLMGKKILMWRNHTDGNFLTTLAVFLSDKVFCTSQYSYTAQFKKTRLMPVGIDTNLFKKNPSVGKKQNSLLFFGRISPVKRPEVFIEACRILKERGIDFTADIVGDPPTSDNKYHEQMKKISEECGLGGTITFKPSISNTEAPSLYNQYEIYINTTQTGSFDKTILEALACETIVVTSNQTLRELLGDEFVFSEGDAQGLADVLATILSWPEYKKRGVGSVGAEKVRKTHNLELLIVEISREVSTLLK